MATYPPYVGGTLSREVRLDGDRVVPVTEPNPERVRLRLTSSTPARIERVVGTGAAL